MIRCTFSIVIVLISLVVENAGAANPMRNVTLLSGRSTRLNCSRNIDRPVEWFHESVGAGKRNLVSTSSIVVGYYRARGKHTLAGGTHDLLLSNASESEAGEYTCRDTNLKSDFDAYDVMVLKSLPHCISNRNLDDLLIDNDCALTPDYVQLNCSVAFRGNYAPVLKWRHSTHPDMVLSRSTSHHPANGGATSILQLKPDFLMNGTYFICSVEDFVPESQSGTCLTRNVTIAYIFHPTTKINPDSNTVTCSANTSSQQCVYRWYGTHVPTNVNFNIESSNQTLQLDESFTNLRCETKCQIRGDECSVTSSVLFSSTLEKSSKEVHSTSRVIVSVIVTALAIGMVFVTVQVIRICVRRRSRRKAITDDADVPLILGGDSKDFDRNTMTAIQEYIDAVNGLTDNLYSKDLLTEEECSGLAEISSYEVRARELLDKLNPRMENESGRRRFMVALIETDQRHIYNYLIRFEDTSVRILNDTELSCIKKNFPCLLKLINSTDYFLDQLVKYRCITETQGDRIKQYNQVKKEKRNRELLAILRRRSFIQFEAFKRVLKKTKQDKVFRIFDTLHTCVVSIHCVSSIDTSVNNVAGIESNICDSLNYTHQLSAAEQRDIAEQIQPLIDNGVELVGASPTGSIVAYFLCESFDAVVFFKKTYDSGELKRMLESVFNIVARSSIRVTVEVNLEETVYKESINAARRTMYYNDSKKKIISPDIMLPAKMSKMILRKALLICWSAGLGNTRHMKTSKSKALFTKFMGEGGKSTCINLKSVSYEWMGMCKLKTLFRQGCFSKQQLLDAGHTAIDTDQCESNIGNHQTTNMAQFLNEIRNFKQNHNKLATKCYQLKIPRMIDDDVEDVIRQFYELKTQPALDRIKLLKDQWRTLDLWKIIQLVNPRSTMEFDREGIIEQDETFAEYKAYDTLRRSIVLCCRFEDVMKELGWKVGVTLDIENNICNVVGKLMMKVTEQDRSIILNCMHDAITNIQARGNERKLNSDTLKSLLTTRKKYNGLNLACILLEQMIVDNKDNNASWMRTVCTQFTDLVVQLVIEPDNRVEVLSILNHLMKLESLWSVADIYILMRNGVFMFQYRQDYLVRYLTMIRSFAVDPSMNVGLSCNKACVRIKSILYCRDESTLGPLNSETYDGGCEKSLDQILSELGEVEIGKAEVWRKIIENSRAILENIADYEHGIGHELQGIKNSEQRFDVDMLSSCLAVTSMALYTSKGFWPSNTQRVSYCLLLTRNMKDNGRLLEISSGEGKSCVIAMVASTYALLGSTVDIITSLSGLSQRDAKEWQNFYTKLNLSASCNVGEVTGGGDGVYDCPIVYGTVETFARDILKSEFLLQNVRKGRECDIVIVDEVDSMLIDQGVQCTYLSHDLASTGMGHFEPILALIWMHVSRLMDIQVRGGIAYHGTKPELFLVTLSSLCHEVDPVKILRLTEDYRLIRTGFTNEYIRADFEEQKQLLHSIETNACVNFFEFAIEYLNLDIAIVHELSIIDAYDTLKRTTIVVLDNGLSSVVFSDDMMKKHLKEMIVRALSDETDTSVVLPLYLKEYCTRRLETWINNAFVAKQMKYGREYITANNAIYPVDYTSTGVIETNKKWGDGLQQFLEMKHGLALSPLSLITNFISNIDFFERYGSNILGVTGTLGNDVERKFVNDTFSIEIATIPTSKRRKLFELEGQILETKNEWHDAVLKQVESATENQRAVLIICEDIATTKDVHEIIAHRMSNNSIHVYTENANDDEDRVKTVLKLRDVDITTNLSARGLDFATDDIVNKNGGLFVLVTFIPLKGRVEKQAFGRTGGRGTNGSCQILVYREKMPAWLRECETVDEAKRLRDSIEMHRLQRTDEVDMMRNKHALFREFCELKNRFVTQSKNDSNDLKIQAEQLDETWANWLQDNEARIQKSNLDGMVQDLREIIEECSEQASRFDSDNIYRLLKFGAVRLMKKDFKGATEFYERVIRMDPVWSAFAHYNRAYCTIKMKEDDYIRRAIDDLKTTLHKLETYKQTFVFSKVHTYAKSYAIDTADDGDDDDFSVSFQKNIKFSNYYTILKCQLFHHIDTQIIETIEKLRTVDTKKEEVKTERRNILDLIPMVDCKTEKMMEEYRQLGILFTFNIDEKPEFCYEAKIVSSFVMMEAVSDILLRLEFHGISQYADSQIASNDINELLCNLVTVNEDSLAWMSRCFVIAVSTGIHSIKSARDVSSLVPLKQSTFGPTSMTNPGTCQLAQVSRSHARNLLTSIATITQDIKKLICLTGDAILPHITNVVKSVLVGRIEDTVHEKLKPGQKLHRALCALYRSVTSQSTPDLQQFIDIIQDLAKGIAHSSQLSDADFKTFDPSNIAADLVSKYLNDSITSTDMNSVITEMTVTAEEIDIIIAVSKIFDLLANSMNTINQNMPEVGYININNECQMLEATIKVLTSVCSDIIHSMVHNRIYQALMLDLREKTMRSLSSIYERIQKAETYLKNTSKFKYLDTVSRCTSHVANETLDLLMRSMTENNAILISECYECNIIILDDDKEVIITYSSPRYRETIQLVYNPPCSEFPLGHYDVYKDGIVIQVTRTKIYDYEDEDNKLWYSAVATALDWKSLIHVIQKIRDHCIAHPRRFVELLASDHYAGQLKHGRALLRPNMNISTTKINQSEHVLLDSSPLPSCIEQASTSYNRSQMAWVMVRYESESREVETSSLEDMTSQVSPDAWKVFLFRGNSVEAKAFRQLVVKKINVGDITTALQLCCIGQQMLFDRNIMDAISSTSGPKTFDDNFERMNKCALYGGESTKFLSICDEWYKVLEPRELMNTGQRELLRKWIIERQYANIKDSVVSRMFRVCSIQKEVERTFHRMKISIAAGWFSVEGWERILREANLKEEDRDHCGIIREVLASFTVEEIREILEEAYKMRQNRGGNQEEN